MKKSIIIVAVIVVILVIVIGAVVMKQPANKPNINTNPSNNQPNSASSANDALTQSDADAIDNAANDINTSSLSDNALNDLG
jgi:hypothetical protein